MRLTNDYRESILSNAMGDSNKAFKKQAAELQKEEDKLATKCYKAIYPIDIIRKANALPDNWLRVDTCLRFNVNGMDIRLYSAKGHRVPNANGCKPLGVITGELADEVTAFANKKQDIDKSYRELRHKISAMLNSVSTVKSLQTVWPDGKPFYEFLLKPVGEKTGLPSVLISEINSALQIGKAA